MKKIMIMMVTSVMLMLLWCSVCFAAESGKLPSAHTYFVAGEYENVTLSDTGTTVDRQIFKNQYGFDADVGNNSFFLYMMETDRKNFQSANYSESFMLHLGMVLRKSDGSFDKVIFYTDYMESLMTSNSESRSLYNAKGEFVKTDYTYGYKTTNFYVGKTYQTNIPVFTCDPASEDFEKNVKDYFETGVTSNVDNWRDVEYPSVNNSANTVEDEHLGYLKNCRAIYTIPLSGKTEDCYYDISWDYSPVTGYGVSAEGGFTMDDMVNSAANTRVEIQIEVQGKKGLFSDYEYIGRGPLFQTFGEMPSSAACKYVLPIPESKQAMGKIVSEKGGDWSDTKIKSIYLRLRAYSKSAKKYHVSNEWVKVTIDSPGEGGTTEEGYFDEDGVWIPDPDGTQLRYDKDGTLIGGKNVPDDWKDDSDKVSLAEKDSGLGWSIIGNFIEEMKSFPQFMTDIFGFLPSALRWAIIAVFFSIVALGVVALVVKILF